MLCCFCSESLWDISVTWELQVLPVLWEQVDFHVRKVSKAVAWVVESLSSVHEVLGLIPSTTQVGHAGSCLQLKQKPRVTDADGDGDLSRTCQKR